MSDKSVQLVNPEDNTERQYPITLASLVGTNNNSNVEVELGNKKPKQNAVTDPPSSGNAVEFISNITQDADGVVTPTKKTVKTMGASGQNHSGGLVPDPGATAGTTKYLCENGTWSEPGGGGGGGGTPTDVQINGTSITNNNVANIQTNSAYNASTNKIATMNDVPAAQVNSDWNAGSGVAQILNKPSTMTPSSHTHGNIQNGGTLQTNDVAPASGDKLVITDNSDSDKVARSSLAFGSDTTKFLRNDGSWAVPAGGGGGTPTDVQMDGISITSNNVANIRTSSGTYNPNSNPLVTLNDIPSIPAAATATPQMDSGNGAVGTSSKYARQDHVHPSDTSKITNPNFPSGQSKGYLTRTNSTYGWKTFIVYGRQGSGAGASDVPVGKVCEGGSVTFIAGNNVTITPDAVNHTITIAATGGGGGGGISSVTSTTNGITATTSSGAVSLTLNAAVRGTSPNEHVPAGLIVNYDLTTAIRTGYQNEENIIAIPIYYGSVEAMWRTEDGEYKTSEQVTCHFVNAHSILDAIVKEEDLLKKLKEALGI